MSYPRIYSLSTVGILKHYMHDYLFHLLRTDFVGGNGVGKSIIADLLQLMFIYDTDLIKFGTDGVSNEPRSIYTLPYKSGIAYCFLNIEVKNGQFITIGIAISAQTGVRIIPFIITRDLDPDKPIEDLLLSKGELLQNYDFLTAQRAIPDLKTLALQLLENKRLYLNAFKTKEEVNKYYQFLYEKNILSINLSVGENLKAFAKVIQSFSKAKALDLRPANASKSLKEFLFEDADTELSEDYASQQYTLEKLLREYNSLDKYIKVLEQKQQGLLRLKEQDRLRQETYKMLKTILLGEKYATITQLRKDEEAHKKGLETEKRNRATLDRKNEKVPRIKSLLQRSVKQAENDYDRHIEYQRIKEESEKLVAEITELRVLNCPVPGKGWKAEIATIDIRSRSTQSIKNLIQMATPILKEFKSLESIEEARSAQDTVIHQLRQELAESLATVKELIAAFKGSSRESIIQWAIQQQRPLSKEQGAVLLHYASLPITKPAAPDKGDRFVEPNQLLNQQELTPVSGKQGFWIRLGAIEEFIETEHDVSLFQDPALFDRSLPLLLNKLQGQVGVIERKQLELDKISKGKDYDRKQIDIPINLWLINYQNIEELKVAVGCIFQIGEKIEQLEEDRKGKETILAAILREMPVKSTTKDPELLKQELRTIRDRQYNRSYKLTAYSTNLESRLKVATGNIRGIEGNWQATMRTLLEEEADFAEQNSQFYAEFSENLSPEDLQTPRPLAEVGRREFEKAQEDYRQKYMELVGRFEETQNKSNAAVNMELEAMSYHFRPLEQALLGNKIKHTDDIAEALKTANSGRLSMADDIKNSMVKIFDKTLKRYKKYKELVQRINAFFISRRISGRFHCRVDFAENKTIRIDFVEEIGARLRNAAKQGELAFDKPVAEFIEEFFRRAGQLKEKVPVEKLLNPKTYFDLSVRLSDQDGQEIPGSTGESYSTIALLGIARLSLVQSEARKGIRFIILEEIGSLDNTNFNTFPTIAREYDYQIITMAPHPFRTNLADEWYAHHLIKGKVDPNINFHPSASYFKTKDRSQDLSTYLKISENELDRTESPS